MGRFFFRMLHSDTRAMGRVLDVVWYDLSVTKAKGSATFPPYCIQSHVTLESENLAYGMTPHRMMAFKNPLKGPV